MSPAAICLFVFAVMTFLILIGVPLCVSMLLCAFVGFITVSGEKMSKSRGTGISPMRYLEIGMNAEWMRYYITAKLNSHVEDLDFNPDDFVARVGKGVIRHLILDRGFIDGESIGRAKQAHGVDTTIGVRSNMDAYRDAAGLATLPETTWVQHTRRAQPAEPPVKRHLIDASRAAPLRQREAKRQQTLARQRQAQGVPEPLPPSQWIAKIDRTTSFSSCPVPLDVVLCSADKNPASEDAWAVMTTAQDATATAVVDRYGLRVAIEERHRHIKCFWDITDFKSPNLNLVVNQVVFTLLTYTLLQQHLLRQGKRALNKATQSRLREKLAPVAEHITVFTDQRYARFSTYEYTAMVMAVPEAARARLAVRLNQRQREFHRGLAQAPPA